MPKEDKNQTEKATSHATGVSVGLGLTAGIVNGSITGDVGLWLSLGIVFGAAFSVVKKKNLHLMAIQSIPNALTLFSECIVAGNARMFDLR
ncbi:MAG: hypothetical protein ACI9JK_000905 [Phycisphaerales bacterium]|jgi:hypothetical protein